MGAVLFEEVLKRMRTDLTTGIKNASTPPVLGHETSRPPVLAVTSMTDLAKAVDQVQLRFGGVLDKSSNPLLDPALSLEAFTQSVNQRVSEAVNNPNQRVETMAELTEVLDKFLQNAWTDEAQPGKRDLVLAQLAKLTGPRGQGNVVMAQIDSIPGDLEGNAKKILNYMDAAEKIGVDTLVLPELALIGYPVRDIIGRHPGLVDENVKWLDAIAKRSGKTRVMVGFVEPRKAKAWSNPTGKNFFNTVAIVANGKIEGLVRKTLLPTYAEFNEDRQFASSPASGVQPTGTLGKASWGFDEEAKPGKPARIQGKNVGITICEDIWNDREYWDRNLYARDPYEEVAESPNGKPDYMVNCSASPSRARKEQMKNNMLSHMGGKYGIPLVYVNRVGAVDEHSFDGSSRVYGSNGELIARSKSFEEQFQIVNPLTGEGKIYNLPQGLEASNRHVAPGARTEKPFNPDDASDLGRTYETIVQGIRSYFQKTGFKRAVLGLSGGLDSTVVAALLADALGPENVLGISIPAKITTKASRDDAKELAKRLGIQYKESPIVALVGLAGRALESLYKKMPKTWGERIQNSSTIANLQARLRAVILWSASNEFKSILPIATSDKSELYMGYATVNGDMSGSFAPIADVSKTKLFALARWMNEHRLQKNGLPQEILVKRPGAELEIDPTTGKTLLAEDALMPYEFMDEVIWRIETKGESYEQMMKDTFWYEENKGLDADTKREWLDKFFDKMSKAVFKWTLLPPGVIVDSQSIMKADYQIPITARVNWRGHSKEQIDSILNEVIQK